ncbi:MAG: lyase [Armatimonadota bacterium]
MMIRRRELIQSALAAAIQPSAALALAAAPRKLASPPKASVAAAIATGLTRYNRNLKGGAHTNRGESGGAPVVLALAAHTGDTSADARLLAQMRYTLTGGNDISANGGYPAQHERNVTAMFALAKLTPRIWRQLSPDEVARVDLLMTAALVASAFTTSDTNPYVLAKTQQYALDGDSNLNRGWNPNFREGMLGMLVVAPVYFGGTARVQSILDTFDHAAFVRSLQKHGLTNLHETFTWKTVHPVSPAPDGPTIQRAIRGYRYLGTPVTKPMELYRLLTVDTYGKTVFCGLNDGKGIFLPDGTAAGMLVSGCGTLPNRGRPGMLKELDSNDAKGRRSSTLYAYDGFRVNLVNQLVLVAGGLWKPGREAQECLGLLRVGIPDFWYRVEHGYRNYAKGHIQGNLDGSGFAFTRPLWETVLKPWHGV